MGDKYGLIRQHSELWRSLRDGDFEEEEIWDVVKEKSEVHIHNETSFPISMPKSLTSAARMIPRRTNNSSSSSSNSSQEIKALQQSSPVNIPNWSEIYRNNKQSKIPKNVSRYSNNNNDYDFYHSVDDDEGEDDVVNNHNGDSENENEEDEYDTKLPPHEIIARRLARSQISSFSVFEGVGRTLKGRDLSKMRNAILTKTGFLESL